MPTPLDVFLYACIALGLAMAFIAQRWLSVTAVTL